MEKIVDAMKTMNCKANEVIFKKGDPVDKLVIVVEGAMKY
jgi:CRP-like cAMP-binding protein